jgi:hypothetical protein
MVVAASTSVCWAFVLLQIKRTEGVSTTDIVGRMLTCTRVNPHMNKAQDNVSWLAFVAMCRVCFVLRFCKVAAGCLVAVGCAQHGAACCVHACCSRQTQHSPRFIGLYRHTLLQRHMLLDLMSQWLYAGTARPADLHELFHV